MNDDRPVGGGAGGKGFGAPSEPAEDFSALSLDQLLTSANWKARKTGYDKITKEPKKHRAAFFDKMAKISKEGNAAAQESLFDALVALVPVCDSDEDALLCQAPLSLVVEKGITGRPKAIASGQAFASLLVENGKQNEVFNALLPAFVHKTPKNRMAAAQLCAKLVSDFGAQHFPIKAILKAMQPLFNDANPQVRKEAISLCCQCYKYIGAGIKGFLTDLRDVQLQELEKQFESVTLGGAPPKQIKGTASGGAVDGKHGAPTPQAVGSLTGNGSTGEIGDAAFDLLDESPVIAKLPKRFFPTALDKNTPWQDRCEYVTNTLIPLLSAPRLCASEDYHELAAMMKAYLTDPQAPLMLLGFQMIQECARGLRAGFANYAKAYISALFDKMKDKKTSVLLHISTTLAKLIDYHCITLDQCHDAIELASQSKNPSQRIALVQFCTQMVGRLDSGQYQRLGRSAGLLKRMVTDEKTENRDAAYVLLGKLVGAFGEGPYKAVFAAMDDKQKARMQIVLASSEHPNGTGGGPAPQNHSATPSNSPAKKLPRTEDLASARLGAAQGVPTSASAPSSDSARRVSSPHGPCPTAGNSSSEPSARGSSRPSANTGRSTTHSLSARPGLSAAPSIDDPISLESTLPPRMEASNAMLGLLNGDTAVHDLLRSHEWSQRLDGMLKIKAVTDQWSAAESTRYFNTLVVYLRSYPTLKESTFQVFQAVLNVLNSVLSKATSVSHGAGYAVVAGCTPRLTDAKNRQPVRDVCSRIAQHHGYRFVIHHMILVVKEVKTPKLMQECNDYFTEVVGKCTTGTAAAQKQNEEDTSEERLDVRGMMDYIKRPCYEQTAPLVRTTSMQLLLVLNRYDTTAVHQWIRSFPPQVIAQFEQQVSSSDSTSSSCRPSTAPNVNGGTGGSYVPPLLPRPASSGLASAASSSTNAPTTATDGVQKRYRASSQSPNRGSCPRPSIGVGGAPLPRPSRRTCSSSARPSVSLSASGNPGSATNRTPLERSLDAGTPRASEVPSFLRPLLREITDGQDWRSRLDAVRKVDEYIDSNNGALPPSAVAPLLKALGTRFDEANKNFVVDVLKTILRVVEASGPEESRGPLKRLMPGALTMLGDQKTMLREEARKVVFKGMDVCGLDTLLQALQRPLGSDSNIARQNTLEAMVYGFENQGPTSPPVSRAGLQLLVPPVVKALMDRIQEVRAAAEQVVGFFIPIMGDEPILRYVQQLKKAEQQVVMPAIERQLSLHPPAKAGAAVLDSTPKAAPPRVNEEEEEEEEEEEGGTANAGRKASHVSFPQPRTPRRSLPATPVHTPRQASQTTPHRPPVVSGDSGRTPSCRDAVTPRKAPLAAGGGGTTNNGNSGLPMPSQPPGPVSPRKASAGRPSISPQRQPTPTDPHTAVATGSAAVPDGSSSSARGGKESKASAASPQQQQRKPQRQPVDKERPTPSATDADMYSTQEILVGLRTATPSVAYNMCVDFMKRVRAGEDCGTLEMMHVMVDRLYENTHKLEPDTALSLIGCLNAMYTNPRSAQRCHRNLIFRMFGTMFNCLLSEQFSLNEVVLKALNNLTLSLLEGCPANEVFSALVSRMTSYSTTYLQSGRKGDLKYIQVTVKCLMRVNLELVSPDNVILSCHEYLLQHPPSAFRDLDDLPIRTVKTLLQTVTKRCGKELLTSADRLVGPQNLVTHFIRACLENRDRAGRAGASSGNANNPRENNEKHAAEESIQHQRASQSPAPKATPVHASTPKRSAPVAAVAAAAAAAASSGAQAHADPTVSSTTPGRTSSRALAAPKSPPPSERKKLAVTRAESAAPSPSPKPRVPAEAAVPTPTPTTATSSPEEQSMAAIFTRIRHHATSQQGVNDLYAYLKKAPANCEEDFNHQFLRCSEAFRLYVKRKLDRKVSEDPTASLGFALPAVLSTLP